MLLSSRLLNVYIISCFNYCYGPCGQLSVVVIELKLVALEP